MIMPCMNSTSACDRGGNFAVVEAGSFLLGWPGAPGWMITGAAKSDFCALAAGTKKQLIAIAARIAPVARKALGPPKKETRPHSTGVAGARRKLFLQEARYGHRLGATLNIDS
jgi:hypothetical protein